VSTVSWQQSLNANDALSLAINPLGDVFVGTCSGAFRSTDSGTDWSFIGLGDDPSTCVFAIGFNATHTVVFAGRAIGMRYDPSMTGPGGGGPSGLYKSIDDGDTWVSGNLGNSGIFSVSPTPSGALLAGTSSQTFRSTDDAVSWANVGCCRPASFAVASNGDMLAGTFDGGLFRSTDDGRTWTPTGFPLTPVFSIAVTASGHVFAGTYSTGIFRSTDYGTTWNQVNGNLSNPVTSLAVNSAGEIFAGVFGEGVFRSSDDGQTWSLVNDGLTDPYVRSLAFNSADVLFAGTRGGVFRTVAATTVPPTCVPPPSGLVSWWPGEDNANDIIGANNGTLQGGAAFGGGEVGQAFDLNGSSAYVRVANAPSLDTPDGFTVMAWIYPRAFGGPKDIASKWDDPTGQWSWIFKLHNDGSGRLRIEVSRGDHNALGDLGGVQILPLNTWSHVAATFDRATGRLRLYVNGQVDNEGFSPYPGTAVNNSATDILVGAVNGQVTTPAEFFQGSVDELELYDRALSTSEIQSVFAAAAAGKCTPPVIMPPVADAGGPYSGVEEAAVSFDASASSDPQGLPLTYDWDFGDGSPHGSGATPTHVYGNSGTYTVTVTVSNGGASASASTTATISPPSCAPAPSGLVSWWPGDYNANDFVDANNGTLQGGATFAAGKVRQAFAFGGPNDFVRIVGDASLQPTAGLTMEAWIDPSSANTSLNKFISKDFRGDGTWNPPWASYILELSEMRPLAEINLGGGDLTRCLLPDPLPVEVFAHIAATYDGTNINMYVNGVLKKSCSGSGQIAYGESVTDLAIGTRSPYTPGEGFRGLVDEVEIYDQALSASEVQATFNAGSAGHCQPPVASVGGPYTGPEGASISFDGGGSTDLSGLGLTYAWDFGDGSATASGKAPSRVYADNGTYTVTLTVSDGHLTSSAATTASVSNVAPTATFNHPSTTKEGSKFTISFTNPLDPSSVDQAAGFTYAFDCGNGYGAFSAPNSAGCPTVDNGSIPIHAKLRDKDGGVQEYTALQTVTNVVPNVTLNAASSQKIKVGGSFTVNGSFTDAGVQDAPWTVTIDWGNGTTTTTATAQGSPIVQSRVYSAAGTYQVRMKVTDKDGGTGMSSAVTVKVQ
jgi:PKD repeat protein